MTLTIKRLAWGFVFITVGLFVSVGVLIRNLAMGNKKVDDLPNVFKSEAKHLSFILIFFSFTYMVRFISDYWIYPSVVKNPSALTATCVLPNGSVAILCPIMSAN